MNRSTKNILKLALMLGFTLGITPGWIQTARAYIPPSQFIVKSWANKHAGMKSLRVKTTVTAYDENKPTSLHFKELSIYFPELQSLRSWALDDSDRKLYFIEEKIDQVALPRKLLLSKDWQGLIQSLKEKGIPIKTEQELLSFRTEAQRRMSENQSLVSWNGGILWAVGSETPKLETKQEQKNPQIWFEKDTFLPFRILYPKASSGHPLLDVRFEGYRYFHEFPYPQKIEVLEKSSLVFASQLIEIHVDSDKHHSVAGTSGFTESGNAAPSKLQDFISQYYDQLH